MALNSTQRKILAPILALGTAILIINIFQWMAPLTFGPFERENPFSFYEHAEQLLPTQIRNELLGITLGLFAGAVFSMLLYPTMRLYMVNLIPLILLFLISLNGWHFWLAKELIWLLLPVWVLISMAGFYTGRFIQNKLSKRKLLAQGK